MKTQPQATRVDFHCHSSLSDGYFPPEVVAEKLLASGVHFAALTDHNTADGLKRFQEVFERRGGRCVSGAEVNVDWNGENLHLLAYGFDPSHPAMAEVFKKVRPLGQAVAAIHEAGGKTFLAHPFHNWPEPEKVEAQCGEMAAKGLDGIEAIYRHYDPGQQGFLIALADRLNLLTVAGSDFHGPNLPQYAEAGMDFPTERWKAFRDSLGHALIARNGKTEAKTFSVNWKRFSLRFILPALLSMALYSSAFFAVILPQVEESLLDRKREMIRELTNSAWSVLSEYEREAKAGRLSPAEARHLALERIRFMRYGKDGKDYFWITDTQPRMLMHPWRDDLEGKNLSHFSDPDGVRLFEEIVQLVKEKDSGYVDYVWQWKDDPGLLLHKESYVRIFRPWGWIIGTGIYLEDVEAEINAITGSLIDISFLILLVMAGLLLFMTHQSLRLEKRRRQAEADLRESHEKYRMLAEAAREGILMTQDGRCLFANATFLQLAGYEPEEIPFLDLSDVLETEETAPLREKVLKRAPFEARLRYKTGTLLDVMVRPSPVTLNEREAHILVVRDMTRHRAMEAELGASRQRLEELTESLDLALARLDLSRQGRFIEANAAARKLFQLSGEEPEHWPLFPRLFSETEEAERLLKNLETQGHIRGHILTFQNSANSPVTLSLHAVLAPDEVGHNRYADIVVEDITEKQRAQREQEKQITEMQTALLFMNEPVQHFARPLERVRLDETLSTARRRMARKNCGLLAITDNADAIIGAVTYRDLALRETEGLEGKETPLYRIMSAPLITLPEKALIHEALLKMQEREVRHLFLEGNGGTITGYIRDRDVTRFHVYSPTALVQEIRKAEDLEGIIAARNRLPRYVKSLADSGAQARHICRAITLVNDGVSCRIMDLTLAEMGAAPLPFAFIVFGSEGREEQTLCTDQDNGIILADSGDPVFQEEARKWALELGRRVCGRLHQAGYTRCKGGMMAENPEWTQPLEKWKNCFRRWIGNPDSEELLRVNMFFDFRCLYGETRLVDELRAFNFSRLQKESAFFLHLARNVLHYKPPLGLFGQIITGNTQGEEGRFNVKDAMIPILHFARLYALQNNVEATNTLERLQRLEALGVLKPSTRRDLETVYQFLMLTRLRRQAETISRGENPDNLLNPDDLPELETALMKQAFSQISRIQKKISFDFMGSA